MDRVQSSVTTCVGKGVNQKLHRQTTRLVILFALVSLGIRRVLQVSTVAGEEGSENE